MNTGQNTYRGNAIGGEVPRDSEGLNVGNYIGTAVHDGGERFPSKLAHGGHSLLRFVGLNMIPIRQINSQQFFSS